MNITKTWLWAAVIIGLTVGYERTAYASHFCHPPRVEGPPNPRLNPPVVPPGGAGLPVFDASNTAVNAITATRAGQIIINQEQHITLHGKDFVWTGTCWEETGRFLALLAEVLGYGDALHYLRPQPGSALSATYPGFAEVKEWWPLYQLWSTTSLDTLSGTLETVHYQLRPEQQEQEQRLLFEMQDRTQGATGNLDVSQTGNMIALQIVEEQRKLRQMLGATLNAQNIAASHHITYQAAKERVEMDLITNSGVPFDTNISGDFGNVPHPGEEQQ
jgi:hypothetical protein